MSAGCITIIMYVSEVPSTDLNCSMTFISLTVISLTVLLYSKFTFSVRPSFR